MVGRSSRSRGLGHSDSFLSGSGQLELRLALVIISRPTKCLCVLARSQQRSSEVQAVFFPHSRIKAASECIPPLHRLCGFLGPIDIQETAAHASLESKWSRGFPLIIISVINKSGRQCFKGTGDGPCTIPWIGLIQHAAKDAGEKSSGVEVCQQRGRC